jgi:hypothetical protein
MTEIIVKVMVKLLSVLALTMEQFFEMGSGVQGREATVVDASLYTDLLRLQA